MSGDSPAADRATYPSAWRNSSLYSQYVLGVLFLIQSVNYGERYVISMMLDPIGREFQASDTMLGLLAGAILAISFAIFSIPVGFACDRFDRRCIAAASTLLFGVTTMISGFVTKFGQLIAVRTLTSIGLSGTEAPSYSMLSDLYPPEKRGLAVARLQTGGTIGLLVTFFIGGLILQYWGWRTTFLVAGLPAVILSVVLFVTVREPVRGQSDGLIADTAVPALAVIRFIARQRALLLVVVGAGLATIGEAGLVSFLPTFLSRAHGLSPLQTGTIASIIFGIVCSISLLTSGTATDRLSAHNIKWKLWFPALALLCGAALLPVLLFASGLTVALGVGAFAIFLIWMMPPPIFSLTQFLVPVRMRGTSMAILLFVLNILGFGIGPPVVGWVSDTVHVAGAGAGDGLRWGLLAISLAYIPSAICFCFAARFLVSDRARVEGY